MSRIALTGARIFDGEAMRDGHAIIIDGDSIESIVTEKSLPASMVKHNLGGGIIAPGFIDAQVNGGGGALLNDPPAVDTVRRIAESHRKFGTTGMLPTVITDTPEVTKAAASAVADARKANVPGVLGIHIEGPFIDPRRRGAHPAECIRPITDEDIAWLTRLDCGTVMLTLAPSTVSPDVVRRLAEASIIVSLGHAEATSAEALAALDAGARGFTHLFNAMSQLGHRNPGMVGAALCDRESYCGIVADGHHVDPLALRVALAAKPKGRVYLVSDAMPPAAGGPPAFTLQGRTVSTRNGRLELPDGTLAGSILTMDEAVRYCIAKLGVTIEEALRMASLYSAAFLRLDRLYGRIASGYRASLVHLDDALAVQRTWIDGMASA
jgi:N-acetylglucosamine-6-phosphate deacetylase